MDHAENEKYKDLNQTFSAKKEDVAINDSRQLMRRNTSEAWTELEFTGSNETPYTARWYVARAHRKIQEPCKMCAGHWKTRKAAHSSTKE